VRHYDTHLKDSHKNKTPSHTIVFSRHTNWARIGLIKNDNKRRRVISLRQLSFFTRL